MLILEKTTAAFIKDLEAQGGKPLYELTPKDARKVLEKVQSGLVEKPKCKIEEKKIPGPKGDFSIHIVRPEHSVGKLPVVMYFHGGGWILGSFHTHERLICELATGSESAFVFVDYTPSPEAKFPIPIEQAYAATKYIAEHGNKFDLDTSRLAVAGDSVGGNMAIVITLLAKERKGPKIDYQVLFYPVTSAEMNTTSYKQFANGPWLTKPAMAWFWDAYEPNVAARKNHLCSPLNATLDQLKGLPPALLITDENDVLRDEGEAYASKLMQAGVEVTALRFIGTHHDFVMLNALSHTPAARNAIGLANAHIRKIFAKGSKKGLKSTKAA